jgi:hypothetical protein
VHGCRRDSSWQPRSRCCAARRKWDGSKWTRTPAPSLHLTDNDALNAVSCTSPSACTAVGSDKAGDGSVALIERWNGSKWSLQNVSPQPATTLNGVSCTRTECWAVGQEVVYDPSISYRPVIERWTGGTWSVMTIPFPSGGTPAFYGVACHGSSSCTAVGYGIVIYHAHSVPAASVEHWNGHTWKLQPRRLRREACRLGLNLFSIKLEKGSQTVRYRPPRAIRSR